MESVINETIKQTGIMGSAEESLFELIKWLKCQTKSQYQKESIGKFLCEFGT